MVSIDQLKDQNPTYHVSQVLYASMGKRSAHVAPEVDLGECILHSPLQKANKAEPTLALKPRGDVTRNPKERYLCPPPPKGHVSAKNFKKMKVLLFMKKGFQNYTYTDSFSFT